MSNPEFFDDEIDLKELVRTLLRAKFWIIGLTLVALVAGFAASKLVLPKTYQATAYVVITKPVFTANLDQRIQQASQTLDSKSLIDMSQADDLILDVMQFFLQAGRLDSASTLSSFKGKLAIKLVGTTQLSLMVTDTDPELAAAVANTWAERAAARLNTLYDLGASALTQMEQQVVEARQKWDSTEQALLVQIPESQEEALQTLLNQQRDLYKNYLGRIGSLDSLVTDVHVLQGRLASQNDRESLLPGDALNLVLLQQQMLMNAGGLQVDIVLSEPMGESYTIIEAQDSLEALVLASENQRSELQTLVDATKAEIAVTATALETAQYQITRLTVERDLAQNAYQALVSQVAETRILLAQNIQTAKVASVALPPQSPSGPRSLMNALIAGAAGFVLSVFAVLVINWWKSPETLKSSDKS